MHIKEEWNYKLWIYRYFLCYCFPAFGLNVIVNKFLVKFNLKFLHSCENFDKVFQVFQACMRRSGTKNLWDASDFWDVYILPLIQKKSLDLQVLSWIGKIM